MATIYTVGHGARSTEALLSIVKEAGIETLLDVRAYPASRRHPQFAKQNLAASAAQAGIAYDWLGKALGGYRKMPYPEHMKTAAFRAAAAGVAARPERCCLMCAESDPEQCHRFHIADWLVGQGHRVVHLLALGRSREHALHPQEDLWRDV
jgi:uncharacterized protein (DUF488 family)